MVYKLLKRYVPIQVCIKKRSDGEFLLVLSEDQELYYLNETAGFLYNLMDGSRTLEEITEELKAEYDVSEVESGSIEYDIVETVRSFQWQNIIQLKEVIE